MEHVTISHDHRDMHKETANHNQRSPTESPCRRFVLDCAPSSGDGSGLKVTSHGVTPVIACIRKAVELHVLPMCRSLSSPHSSDDAQAWIRGYIELWTPVNPLLHPHLYVPWNWSESVRILCFWLHVFISRLVFIIVWCWSVVLSISCIFSCFPFTCYIIPYSLNTTNM